jgi:thiol-disulfide isomerase/thioredoxin
LLYAGVAAAAGIAGALVGPLVLQRQTGAGTLLSTVFPDLQGQARRLRDWDGHVAVVNFWATWCAPCREEIPLLVAARARYRADGVEVVGIGIDQVDKLRDFAAKFSINYPVLVGDLRALDVMRELGNQAGALPYTVVLDRSGRVASRRLGAYQPGELDQVLAGILR